MHVSCGVVEMLLLHCFLNVFLLLAVDQRDAQVLFVCKFLQSTSDLMFLPMLRVLIKALSYLTWQIYQFLHLGFFGVSNWGNTVIILTFFFWFNLCFSASSNFGFMYVFSLTVFRYGYVLWFDVYVNRPCFVTLFIVILVLSRRSLQSRTRSEYKRYSSEICGTLDLDLM